MKLLAGKPINVEGIGPIKPRTLGEIADFGWTKHNECLYIMTIEKAKAIEDKETLDKLSDLNDYQFLVFSAINDQLFKARLLEGFLFFTGKLCYIDQENLCLCTINNVVVDKEDIKRNVLESTTALNTITADQYKELCTVLKLQNGMTTINKYEDEVDIDRREDSDLVKYYKEKSRKYNEIVKKQKGNNDEMTMEGLVNAFAAKVNGINIINVWDTTLYSFYAQLNKVRQIEEYDVAIQSIMHGADASKIKLKHWILNPENEE